MIGAAEDGLVVFVFVCVFVFVVGVVVVVVVVVVAVGFVVPELAPAVDLVVSVAASAATAAAFGSLTILYTSNSSKSAPMTSSQQPARLDSHAQTHKFPFENKTQLEGGRTPEAERAIEDKDVLDPDDRLVVPSYPSPIRR
jgi:hypothetical protein